MMKKVAKFIFLRLAKLCSLVMIILATITINQCDGQWYQSKEPDGFWDFLKSQF